MEQLWKRRSALQSDGSALGIQGGELTADIVEVVWLRTRSTCFSCE